VPLSALSGSEQIERSKELVGGYLWLCVGVDKGNFGHAWGKLSHGLAVFLGANEAHW
jgi:hypothetical protein